MSTTNPRPDVDPPGDRRRRDFAAKALGAALATLLWRVARWFVDQL